MSVTRTQFEDDLLTLRQRLLEMATKADSMVASAVQALIEQDAALADHVIQSDDQVDTLDLDIEHECMRLIACQQPLARDLRLIGTAMKIITDLERIGDHAVDIAKVARRLAGDTFYRPIVDLPHMATSVRDMLRSALDAFVNHDLELVSKVVHADDDVDAQYYSIRADLHAEMQRDPTVVVQASYLLFVAHYLERVADHAVNIAERVYYVETGQLAQLAMSHKSVS